MSASTIVKMVLAMGMASTMLGQKAAIQPIVLPAHGVKKPKLVHQINPPNPPHAHSYSSVSVVVEYTVGTDGKTHDWRILRSRGGTYDARAIWTVRHFVYRPATEHGQPVAVVIKRKVDFIWPIPDYSCGGGCP